MPGNNGDDYVQFEPLSYHQELLRAFSQCRRLRSRNSPDYVPAVETFFFFTLSTDRQKTGWEHAKRLADDMDLQDEVEHLKNMKEEKRDPWSKAQDTDQKRDEIDWVLADIFFEAGRRALEDHNDFKRKGKAEMPTHGMKKRRVKDIESGRNPR